MRKLFVLLLLQLIFITPVVESQETGKRAGLRTGYYGGLFFQFTSGAGNAEVGYNAMLSFRNNGAQFTGLRIIYETALSDISPDLFFAWGFGGHTGFIITDNIRYFGERYTFQDEKFCPVFGADGWLAAEYRFREIPLIIGVNIKPFIELILPSFVKLMPGDVGISISYTF